MIRFRCQKCNNKVTAPNLSSGIEAHCPKCKHVMVVPGPNVSADQKNTSSSVTYDQQKNATGSSHQSTANQAKSIAAQGRLVSNDPGETKQDDTKKKASFLRPYYDETTLFSMSITFILLCMMSRTLWTDGYKFYRSGEGNFAGMLILILFVLTGAFLSVFHAFSKRMKSLGEKSIMLLFAVVFSFFTGIYAGRKMFETFQGWLIIFPVWNIIYALLLGLMYRRGAIDESSISDKNASLFEVIVTGAVIFIVILCCEFWFELHWIITCSICLTYSTSLNRAFRGLFGPN